MSSPDRRTRCVCGHLTAQHGHYGARACREVGCDCAALQKAPQPCCLDCGHVLSFHSHRGAATDGALECAATGCNCPSWADRQSLGASTSWRTAVQANLHGRSLNVEFTRSGQGETVRLKFRPSGEVDIFFSSR